MVVYDQQGNVSDLANCPFKLKVWNKNLYTFQQDAYTPSIGDGSLGFGYSLGLINMGSTVAPVGTQNGNPVYYIGWDGLNIPLPANVPLQFSLQARAGVSSCDLVKIYSSNLIAGTTLAAAGCEGCIQSNSFASIPFSLRVMVQ